MPTAHQRLLTLTEATLPRRTRMALEFLLTDLRTALSERLPLILQETELALARLPASSDPKQEDARHAAMRSLGGGARAFGRMFLAQAEHSLAALQDTRRRHAAKAAPPAMTLSLLDEETVSDQLVLENMANRLESRNSLGLQLLGYRIGVLAGAPAFEGQGLPLGPHALCSALDAAANELKLSRHARMHLFQQFERTVVELYPTLLDTFNARLVRHGILPYLSFIPMRVRPPTPSTSPDTGSSGDNIADILGALSVTPRTPPAAAAAPAAEEPAESPSEAVDFQTLQALLMQRRALLAKLKPASASDERQREALARTEVLETLQRMRSDTSTGKAESLADIRQILLAQARQAHGHGMALNNADGDSFDLLGMFMAQLQGQLRKSSPGEALLERMRLPLMQLALRDQNFFDNREHPARQLLDAISTAGARWLADDDIDAQWLGLLQRAASSIQQDANGSPATFAEANQTLQSGLQALDRKAEMAERRQIDAARGRDRLEVARLRADAEIRRLLAGRELPRFHASLIEQAWTDVLSLTHLRNGEDSDAWRQLLGVTANIIAAGTEGRAPTAMPGFIDQVKAALEQVGYHAEDASAIARQLVNGPGADDEATSRTELLAQLRARARLGEGQAIDTGTPARAPRTPEEQAAFERLRALTLPAWVDLDEGGDAPQRRRLAWISAQTDQVLLVNRRGLRVGNEDLDSLARKLAHGQLRLLESHAAPAQAAWDATVSSLRRVAGDRTTENTTP